MPTRQPASGDLRLCVGSDTSHRLRVVYAVRDGQWTHDFRNLSMKLVHESAMVRSLQETILGGVDLSVKSHQARTSPESTTC